MNQKIVQQQRRHVLAEDLKHNCPFAGPGRYIACQWSDGMTCNVTTEHAADCELNNLEDAAACEEAAIAAAGKGERK